MSFSQGILCFLIGGKKAHFVRMCEWWAEVHYGVPQTSGGKVCLRLLGLWGVNETAGQTGASSATQRSAQTFVCQVASGWLCHAIGNWLEKISQTAEKNHRIVWLLSGVLWRVQMRMNTICYFPALLKN